MDKIKLDIFSDRVAFLGKLVQLVEKKHKNAGKAEVKVASNNKTEASEKPVLPLAVIQTKAKANDNEQEQTDPTCKPADYFRAKEDCKPGDKNCADGFGPDGECKPGENCADTFEPEGAETCAPGDPDCGSVDALDGAQECKPGDKNCADRFNPSAETVEGGCRVRNKKTGLCQVSPPNQGEAKKSKKHNKHNDNKTIKNDTTNLELELDETADLMTVNQTANATAVAALPLLAQKTDPSEVAIPKWPTYSQPIKQFEAIKKELQQVKSEKQHWDKLLKEAEASSKIIKKDDKQALVQNTHSLKVDKIKLGIYGDRVAFLEKLVQLVEKKHKKTGKAKTQPNNKTESAAQEKPPVAVIQTKSKSKDNDEDQNDPTCKPADFFRARDDCKPGDKNCADGFGPDGECKPGENCADTFEPEGAETCAPGDPDCGSVDALDGAEECKAGDKNCADKFNPSAETVEGGCRAGSRRNQNGLCQVSPPTNTSALA